MSEEKDFEMTIGEIRQQKGMKNFGKVFCWIFFTLGGLVTLVLAWTFITNPVEYVMNSKGD